MIVIKSTWFPPFGFLAITLWPFIIHKPTFSAVDLNHEMIHAAQQQELLVIGFYIIYLFEWIFKGYDNISFEKEAYDNQNNLNYLKTRKRFANFNF